MLSGSKYYKECRGHYQLLGRDKSLVQWVEQSDRNKEFIFGLLVAGRNYYAVMHGQMRGCGARLISGGNV